MDTDNLDSIYTLPIYDWREDILNSVDRNQVTIITAETGAGKSTQVPQFLAEHGYKKIIVTQPRILAARNLSHRVRQEYSWRLGRDATDLVGYRTAQERDDDSQNVILYCTDGLQLVRELTGSGTGERQILVLDEIHEWNENMEVLIAWAKKRCQENPDFKIVMMSATIEAESLAEYFGAPKPITVPGRSYNVDIRYGTDVIAEITNTLESRKSNMLVFLPGKAEIESVGEEVQKVAKNVPIIPLHSQLEPEDQQKAFKSYPKGKVVLSTNVAQTSITIDDIDVVIDSGLERRSEVRSGVEGLFMAETSKADCMQRAGRAGRTKEGLYILAQLEAMPCSKLEDRPEYGVPEILRKHIDRLVLRLANIGIDIEDLDFYHSPSRKTIKQAKRTLVSLGALTGAGEVTDIGRKMERFPVESSYARMLVEAEQYSVEVQIKLAVIIAIQEVGGIVKGGARHTGWQKFTRQTLSDLIAQYEVYLSLPSIDDEDYEELGIIGKNVTKAQEVNERLNRDLGLAGDELTPVAEAEMTNLLRCIVAGQLHQIWITEAGNQAVNIYSKKTRELSSSSVVKHSGLLAGTPFDLEIPTPKGLETLQLVNDLTVVDPQWLKELAPDLFKVRPGKVYFDGYYGTLARSIQVKFRNKVFETSSAPILERTSENKKLFINLYSEWLHEQLEKERRYLKGINHRRIPSVSLNEVRDRVRHIADGAVSAVELPKKQRIELSRLSRLETYFDKRFMEGLKTEADEAPHKHRGRRRPWKPAHKRKHHRRHGR